MISLKEAPELGTPPDIGDGVTTRQYAQYRNVSAAKRKVIHNILLSRFLGCCPFMGVSTILTCAGKTPSLYKNLASAVAFAHAGYAVCCPFFSTRTTEALCRKKKQQNAPWKKTVMFI